MSFPHETPAWAARLEAVSPSSFSAIRRANQEAQVAFAGTPHLAPFLEDAGLIEAEYARRIELNRTARERLDTCVREMNALDRHLSDCEAEAALDNAERFVKALVTAFDYLPDGFVASPELHIALLQANRLVVSLKRDLGLLPAVGRAA